MWDIQWMYNDDTYLAIIYCTLNKVITLLTIVNLLILNIYFDLVALKSAVIVVKSLYSSRFSFALPTRSWWHLSLCLSGDLPDLHVSGMSPAIRIIH